MKLQELVAWYSTLTPETLSQLSAIYHEDARFCDPFNQVQGHAAIARVFEHMFEATEHPRFEITATQTDGSIAWVSWNFSFGLRGRECEIEGVSRLEFAADGRVSMHRDYWDALDLLVELPLLGGLLRFIRGKLGVPGSSEREKPVNQ